MPTATKFWLLVPAIALLALSVLLFFRWPFRIDSSRRDDAERNELEDRLRPLTHRGKKSE